MSRDGLQPDSRGARTGTTRCSPHSEVGLPPCAFPKRPGTRPIRAKQPSSQAANIRRDRPEVKLSPKMQAEAERLRGRAASTSTSTSSDYQSGLGRWIHSDMGRPMLSWTSFSYQVMPCRLQRQGGGCSRDDAPRSTAQRSRAAAPNVGSNPTPTSADAALPCVFPCPALTHSPAQHSGPLVRHDSLASSLAPESARLPARDEVL